MIIRCAQINARGVYVGMVEIEEASAGPRHLTKITECDLTPGEYEWVPSNNAFGGAFWPLASTVDARRPKAIKARRLRENREQRDERERETRERVNRRKVNDSGNNRPR